MTSVKEDILNQRLIKRIDSDSLRELKSLDGLVDFCSNDYLGLARSKKLHTAILKGLDGVSANGSTGSRLISGNSLQHELLEGKIAAYHKAESALLYNSGYTANLGLFSCIGTRNDTIIYDELIHASIRDGIRLGQSRSFSFAHNDLEDLKQKLSQATGEVYVAVESVYSMDGDFADLNALAELSKVFGCRLIVDEAHAAGVFGENGEGRVVESALEQGVFARIVTYGKAFGVHGAAVLGSEQLKAFLVNYSRSFIYTTAMPESSLIAIEKSYEIINHKVFKISNIIKLFKEKIKGIGLSGFIPSDSPIQSIIIPGNGRVKGVASYLQSKGFGVIPVLSPTVPEGMERIRICVHEYNTEDEIVSLLTELKAAIIDA